MQFQCQNDKDRSVKYSFKILLIYDVDKVEKKIVKFVQEQLFVDEKSEIVIKGRLVRFKLFEDEGIICVGGRLNYLSLLYDVKYLMILLVKYFVFELIICYYYYLNGYVGIY